MINSINSRLHKLIKFNVRHNHRSLQSTHRECWWHAAIEPITCAVQRSCIVVYLIIYISNATYHYIHRFAALRSSSMKNGSSIWHKRQNKLPKTSAQTYMIIQLNKWKYLVPTRSIHLFYFNYITSRVSAVETNRFIMKWKVTQMNHKRESVDSAPLLDSKQAWTISRIA